MLVISAMLVRILRGAGQDLQQGTRKAAAITRQLLAFSRKQVLDIQPMDLHAALTESHSMLTHLLGSGTQLQLSPDAARSWIRSDLAQIIQVLINLASNSRDARPNGRELLVSTRNADKPPAIAPAAASDVCDWVVLEVRDTGAGMDKATLAQVFEPFFTTKPVGKGTGLGLSTVYGVVRQSGGFIHVESEPGQGTHCQIYLPAVATPQAVPVTLQPASGSSMSESATVLLVDDEIALVHAIGEFLRECGYIVLHAFSSQDALELAKEYPGRIEILVSDMVMPDARGPDLHRRVLELQPEMQVLSCPDTRKACQT